MAGKPRTPDPYRYTLHRYVSDNRKTLLWVMLNPSTADDVKDDPTIRRVMTFTARHGYGRLTVVNLFAKRATDPNDLFVGDVDPVGPMNGRTLSESIERADAVVAAWGATKIPEPYVRPNIEAMVQYYKKPLYCLGRNGDGSPKHPLYLASSTPFVHYP